MKFNHLLLTALSTNLLLGCAQDDPGKLSPPISHPGASENKASNVSFAKSIKPMLSNQCTICHNSRVLKNRPYFESRVAAMTSGMIVPGNPQASRIISVVEEQPMKEKAMPPVGHQLTPKQVADLRRWITEGADWPAGSAGQIEPAFIPLE